MIPPAEEPEIPDQPDAVAEPEPVSDDTPEPDAEDEEDELDEELSGGNVPLEGSVKKSPLVPNSYFDDALFIGDSISTGIPLYHMADNAEVVAMAGLSPLNINTRKCIDIGEEEPVTVLEAAMQYPERKKIYIMLGGNGTGLNTDTFVEGYETFLDSIKAAFPGATIYLQSITPVVDGYENDQNPNLNNETIDELNLEILAIAKRKNVHFLDLNSYLKDENGNLPEEASPVDGLHFTPEYYAKWFEYLRTHTVASEDK